MYFVLCIVCFVLFYVLIVCKCVLYYFHRLSTQLQLTNIPYHIIVTMISAHLCLYVGYTFQLLNPNEPNFTKSVMKLML